MTHFFTSETGAVTVDWVVLTAALVGLGLAAMGVVSNGVEDLSGDTETALKSKIVSASFVGSAQHTIDTFDVAGCSGGRAGLSEFTSAWADITEEQTGSRAVVEANDGEPMGALSDARLTALETEYAALDNADLLDKWQKQQTDSGTGETYYDAAQDEWTWDPGVSNANKAAKALIAECEMESRGLAH